MQRLKWFNDIIIEYLEEKNLSLNQFSKTIKVPYASVHRMLHGQQNIGPKDVDKFLSPLVFSEFELKALGDAYKAYSITKEERQSIEMVRHMLENLNDTLGQKRFRQWQAPKEEGPLHQVVEGKESVAKTMSAAVLSRYNEALQKAKDEGVGQRLSLRFRLPIIEVFFMELYEAFNYIEEKQVGTQWGLVELDFQLLVTMDTSVKNENKVKNMKVYEAITKLLVFKAFLRIDYTAFHNSSDMDSYFIYQYYFIIGNTHITVYGDGESAVLFRGQGSEPGDVNRHYMEKHNSLPIAGNMARTFDISGLNVHMLEMQNRKDYFTTDNYTLRFTLSSMVLPLEIMTIRLTRQLKRMNLKVLSQLAETVTQGYTKRVANEQKKIKSKKANVTHFYTEEGIEDIFRTGLVSDYYEILGSAEPYERALILVETLKQMNNGLDICLLTRETCIRNPFLQITKGFEIYMDVGDVMVARHLDRDKANILEDDAFNLVGKSIDYAIVLDQPIIVKALELFYNKILKRMAVPPDQSFQIIKDMGLQILESYESNPKIKKKLDIVRQMSFTR